MHEEDFLKLMMSLYTTDTDRMEHNLNQAIAERDGRIAGLNQAIAERDGRIAGLNHRLVCLESSWSWRMTAPFRWLGRFVKALIRGLASTRLLSRVIVATLLLPAAWQYFDGFGAVMRRLGRGAIAEVIAGQTILRERLSSRSPLLQRFVLETFSLALRLQRAGSVKRLIGNLLRIVRAEGIAGIRGHMITTVPDMSGLSVQVEDWGEKETRKGQAVNCQPDGSSALWIRAKNVSPFGDVYILFGEHQTRTRATVVDDLITCEIPEIVVHTVGSYPVIIKEASGRCSQIGTFIVNS